MPYCVQVSWDDVPHLDEEAKSRLLESFPPHERDARRKGEPHMGAGIIYPVPFDAIEVAPFAPPAHWKKAYAMDVGWNKTACLWGAKNPVDSTIYLYAEHYMGQAVPSVHADAVKARGSWIRGAIDPAAGGSAQADGTKLAAVYSELGLNLMPAKNAVEAGIYEVWQLLASGRLKAFSTLQSFKKEYGLYRRDENGKIVKQNDHLMDCMRYLVNTWDQIATVQAPDMPTNVTLIGDNKAGY